MRQHKDYKHHGLLHGLSPDKAAVLDGAASALVVVESSSKGELLVLSNCCRAVNRSVNNVMVSQLYQAVAVCVAPHLTGNRDAMELVRDIFQAAQCVLGSPQC
jgi:hypothetical protein